MKVLCVFSDHRAHKSKSPLMHNGVIRARGLENEYMYAPFEIASPESAVAALKALNISGANVTVPYKQGVMPYLDRLSPEAAAVGAVNTIVPESGGGLAGYNTDIGGFLDSLSARGIEVSGKSVLLVGTGGAARGLLEALRIGNAREILLAGRTPEKTTTLAQETGATALPLGEISKSATQAEIVVNSAAVSAPSEAPEVASLLENYNPAHCQAVVDINYGREQNFWQDLAKRQNALFIDGLPMLAWQACRSFRLWTGIDVTGQEFERALGI